ncbi:MAG TPA: DUF2382 domain-containing protein [Allosphingosinicella sp.]|nr:DUF2382 domain-containing protein [Allosphingosinicella sp.]
MSPESHAAWLPRKGDAAAPAQPLSTAEPQLVSGGAQVVVNETDAAQGAATAPVRPSGRVLGAEEIATGGFFTERVIEMAETREEAVVEKHVVVREEVVLRKNAAEHVETVQDSVRRTEVEVVEISGPQDGLERLE